MDRDLPPLGQTGLQLVARLLPIRALRHLRRVNASQADGDRQALAADADGVAVADREDRGAELGGWRGGRGPRSSAGDAGGDRQEQQELRFQGWGMGLPQEWRPTSLTALRPGGFIDAMSAWMGWQPPPPRQGTLEGVMESRCSCAGSS